MKHKLLRQVVTKDGIKGPLEECDEQVPEIRRVCEVVPAMAIGTSYEGAIIGLGTRELEIREYRLKTTLPAVICIYQEV